jgi:acetyl-CoA acetyltransferase
MERAGLQRSDIDTVVMGQVVQAGAKMNRRAKRQSALKSPLACQP